MSEQLFDLTLTEEQRITREAVRRFAEQELKTVARSADEAAGAPEGFYQKTMELGLTIYQFLNILVAPVRHVLPFPICSMRKILAMAICR